MPCPAILAKKPSAGKMAAAMIIIRNGRVETGRFIQMPGRGGRCVGAVSTPAGHVSLHPGSARAKMQGFETNLAADRRYFRQRPSGTSALRQLDSLKALDIATVLDQCGRPAQIPRAQPCHDPARKRDWQRATRVQDAVRR